jgi:hypothetical protein
LLRISQKEMCKNCMKKTIKPGRMIQQVMSKYCVPKQRLAKMVKSSSLLILLVNVQMIQSKFQLKCLVFFFFFFFFWQFWDSEEPLHQPSKFHLDFLWT